MNNKTKTKTITKTSKNYRCSKKKVLQQRLEKYSEQMQKARQDIALEYSNIQQRELVDFVRSEQHYFTLKRLLLN